MKRGKGIKLLLAVLLTAALAVGGLAVRHVVTERRAAEERQRALDAVESFSGVLSADELPSLEQYRNLKSVDLRGSVYYDALMRYSESTPRRRCATPCRSAVWRRTAA